jgi:CheY-like chemotaxis protein
MSDVAMPGEDGYDLIRRVRKLPPERGGRIPAVALTAHVGEGARQQAISAGFDRHLAKPVRPAALATTLAALATRGRAG